MKNKMINIFLLLFSVFLPILIGEMSARVYKNEFSFHNFLESDRDLFRSAYPSEFDKTLGWIPKKGSHPKNIWNTAVTILDDGIRSNGKQKYEETNGTILAVGDSFTFGDQVSDRETWPAFLETMARTKVINGGVFGYGIDQSYLRMQTLIPKYRPEIVIFSFVSEDIKRCNLSERSVPKPYCELSNRGDLILMKEHLSPPIPVPLDIFRKVLGYSFLTHKIMIRTLPKYWLSGVWNDKSGN